MFPRTDVTMQVPPEAALRKRGHGVRVLILSRNMVRPNDFLGQADVPLSLLQASVEGVGTRVRFESKSRKYTRARVKSTLFSAREGLPWQQKRTQPVR